MAKNMTKSEKKVWFDILKKLDTKWVKQRIIGSYIVDFFCFEIGLAIEIDGESHEGQMEYDQSRTDFLNSLGIKVIRFTNSEVLNNLQGIFDRIKVEISMLLIQANTPVNFVATPSSGGLGEEKSTSFKSEEVESLNEVESTSFKFSEPESTPFKGSNSQNLGVSITKTDIFHYIYAVLHSPDYRTKYEINLKQDFPRIPFYDDFSKYADLGRELMNLHLGKFEPQNLLEIVEIPQTENQQKFVSNTPILKLDKKTNEIILDNLTKIVGISNKALEYKLGNRSAIEWILDQYKPKKETENDEFDNYNWTKLKPQVIDLLQKVHRISLKTQEIVLELK